MGWSTNNRHHRTRYTFTESIDTISVNWHLRCFRVDDYCEVHFHHCASAAAVSAAVALVVAAAAAAVVVEEMPSSVVVWKGTVVDDWQRLTAHDCYSKEYRWISHCSSNQWNRIGIDDLNYLDRWSMESMKGSHHFLEDLFISSSTFTRANSLDPMVCKTE